ncbi:MAG: HNH endonuclease [Elusimicrobia bacterium]|nr:HNH endonuclease [Elusimicrobiota bacterium]
MSEDRGVVGFTENLLTILDEGRFTATYKFAVLLGLMDLCLERSTESGSAPTSVTTVQLAEKIVSLYWTHVEEFDLGDQKVVLTQNNTGQAEIVSLIRDYRSRARLGPGALLTEAKLADGEGFKALLRNVEWKLVEMPLPRLQLVGTGALPFIYQIGWDESISKREFNGPDFHNTLTFIANAGDHLVQLAGLLRPIIQARWVTLVQQFNREHLRDSHVAEFLFGVDRTATLRLLPDLRELQDNRCFYCDSRVTAHPEIDHFIPWARYPDNGIDNLVVAHDRCNGAKKAFLACSDHVRHWAEKLRRDTSDLAAIAQKKSWARHPERTLGVARGIYFNLPPDAKLWRAGRLFAHPERAVLTSAFNLAVPRS